nr:hypothetical protein [Mesorhizobium sp. L2C054A000]
MEIGGLFQDTDTNADDWQSEASREGFAQILELLAGLLQRRRQRLDLDLGLLERTEKARWQAFCLRGRSLQIFERLAAGSAKFRQLALEFGASVKLNSLFDRSGHGYAPAS